jgi:hypothetical protein
MRLSGLGQLLVGQLRADSCSYGHLLALIVMASQREQVSIRATVRIPKERILAVSSVLCILQLSSFRSCDLLKHEMLFDEFYLNQ